MPSHRAAICLVVHARHTSSVFSFRAGLVARLACAARRGASPERFTIVAAANYLCLLLTSAVSSNCSRKVTKSLRFRTRVTGVTESQIEITS